MQKILGALTFMLVSVAQAGAISGQGTWETTLQPRDVDNDGTVDTDECEKVDVKNVMFWEEGRGTISKEQAWVIRRHPLFYPEHQQ